MDTVILGVNQDSLESHRKFAEEQGYSFPLITDPGRKISDLYELGTMKEHPDLVERAVFVIDADGVIRYAVQGNPSTRELMETLEPV